MILGDIKKIEKGELHVHLNGLVQTSVIRELLLNDKANIPKGFDLEKDLNITEPTGSLISYLKPWDVFRLVPKSRECLLLIVESAFKKLKQDNIKFVELRNSVIYIASLNKITVAEALNWLITAIEKYSNEYQITARLILTVSRGDNACLHLKALLDAYKQLDCPEFVVGLDLAGNEDLYTPKNTALMFKEAKEKYGLGITIHAGETGNVNNIKDAIVNYKADRIGHGTAAIKSLEVMNLLYEEDVCVEVCPVSNRLTNAVRESESHPALAFIDHKVPFVICSDNPAIHISSLSHDYLSIYQETNCLKTISTMLDCQKKFSFIKGLK